MAGVALGAQVFPAQPDEVIGRFQRLKQLQHPHLASYIACVPGRGDQVYLISQHHRVCAPVLAGPRPPIEQITSWLWQLVSALHYLHSHDIVHRCISMDAVRLDSSDNIILANHGIYTLAHDTPDLLIGDVAYLAPEVLASSPAAPSHAESDIWSLGIWLLAMLTRQLPWPQAHDPDAVLAACADGQFSLSQQHRAALDAAHAPADLLEVLWAMLDVHPGSRCTAAQLRSHPVFADEPDILLPRRYMLKPALQCLAPGFASETLAVPAELLAAPHSVADVEQLLCEEQEQREAKAAALNDSTQETLQAISPQQPPLDPPAINALVSADLPVPKSAVDAYSALMDKMDLTPRSSRSDSSLTSLNAGFRAELLKLSTAKLNGDAGLGAQAVTEAARLHELDSMSLADLFHFWQIAGGNLEHELGRAGALPLEPPVLCQPLALLLDGTSTIDRAGAHPASYDLRVVELSMQKVRADLVGSKAFGYVAATATPRSHRSASDGAGHAVQPSPPSAMRPAASSPSLASVNSPPAPGTPSAPLASSSSAPSVASAAAEAAASVNAALGIHGTDLPPLKVREADIEYQRMRARVFRDLLPLMPSSHASIVEEARVDIPPAMRADVWAALLHVTSTSEEEYHTIDRSRESPSDRQIDLDVPRCHQYHELLRSDDAHQRFRRVLRSWVLANPDLVYWQGLDSLCAPLLVLYYANEARVFAMLQALVATFQRGFFHADNSQHLQGQLTVFQLVLGFVDPALAAHLHDVGFSSDLYAIPWFLTLFAHVLPLDQLFRVWDAILTNPPRLVIFIAAALMRQLDRQLIKMSFDELITLFSNLPGLDVDACVTDALDMLRYCPPSITQRLDIAMPVAEGRQPLWWQRAVPLENLRQSLSPFLSVRDLLSMSRRLLLDVRVPDEFAKCHVKDSVNVQPVVDRGLFGLLAKHRGVPIVICGDSGPAAVAMANLLVRAKIPRVSVLHGGIDRLKVTREARPLLVQFRRTPSSLSAHRRGARSPQQQQQQQQQHSQPTSSSTNTDASDPLGLFS